MLARFRKAQEDEGFTLIELLVVMIIIGILAAIAIPVFLNQRKKAQDSAAKADVSTIGKELATYFVDNCQAPSIAITTGRYVLTAPVASGTCTTPAAAFTSDLGKASDNVAITGSTITDDTHWCIYVTNTKGDKQVFKYSAKNGLAQGACVAADTT
jgi:prepilin-type N-terminal cleavage/methylation domain-containing protein